MRDMDADDMCGGGPQGEWREDEEPYLGEDRIATDYEPPVHPPRASMGDILSWEERIINSQELIRACQELAKWQKLKAIRAAIEEVKR